MNISPVSFNKVLPARNINNVNPSKVLQQAVPSFSGGFQSPSSVSSVNTVAGITNRKYCEDLVEFVENATKKEFLADVPKHIENVFQVKDKRIPFLVKEDGTSYRYDSSKDNYEVKIANTEELEQEYIDENPAKTFLIELHRNNYKASEVFSKFNDFDSENASVVFSNFKGFDSENTFSIISADEKGNIEYTQLKTRKGFLNTYYVNGVPQKATLISSINGAKDIFLFDKGGKVESVAFGVKNTEKNVVATTFFKKDSNGNFSLAKKNKKIDETLI